MTSQNINITFKRKSVSIAGVSPMSYSPSSHTMPAIFQHRDSFVHQRELESAFCSDLVCCGIKIKDLHELLHHYEELHHAPIDEETTTEGERATPAKPEPIEEDEEELFPLPTQPHELAALSPRLNTLQPVIQPSPQHTEDILKQHLPALMSQHPGSTTTGEPIPYFSSEALYQTCDDNSDKPYKCPISSCDKAYKNPNGLKYHQMHGHSDENDAEKDAQRPYMCTIGFCNKRYKNLNGLKYHIEHSHIAKLKQNNELEWPPSATF